MSEKSDKEKNDWIKKNAGVIAIVTVAVAITATVLLIKYVPSLTN